MPNLVTGKGFVDIFCADLEGGQEEYIVKVNNTVEGSDDRLVFDVYRSNVITGMMRKYTRTFNFGTVHKDPDDGKSVPPKFFYTGDFNGDGKTEVLAVTANCPYGGASLPTRCYLFDIAAGKILCQSSALAHNVQFIGTSMDDPVTASANSDKLLALDCDGDGKTDLVHINEGGTDIYSFVQTASGLSLTRVATFTSLVRAHIGQRDIVPGDFNGDGLDDFLISPPPGTDTRWLLYSSMGDGQFEATMFYGTVKSKEDNTGFMAQDINGDGKTDLVKYDANGFYTYLSRNSALSTSECYTKYQAANSILVPTDINSGNTFTKLVSLDFKGGNATSLSFSRDDDMNAKVTGMVNSLGAVERTDYGYINEAGQCEGFYSPGYGAAFPYVNIQEPLAVVTSWEKTAGGRGWTAEAAPTRMRSCTARASGSAALSRSQSLTTGSWPQSGRMTRANTAY